MKKLLITLLIGVFLIGIASAAVPQNLVDFYDFEETSGTTLFSSTGLHNGTNSGATIQASGIKGYGYDFEATENDIVNLSSVVLPTTHNADYTINAWIKIESFANNPMTVVSQYNTGAANRTLILDIRSNGSVQHGTSNGNVYSNAALSAGQWYMVTVVNDGENKSIFINGTFDNSNNINASLGNYPTVIGGTNTVDTGLDFDGLIDRVALYNRSLTQAEINTLYLAGNSSNPYQDSAMNPQTNNSVLLTNEGINITVQSTSYFGLTNVSLYINGTINETVSISGYENVTTFSKMFDSSGTRNYLAQTCDANTCFNSSGYQLTVNNYQLNSNTYNTTTYQTKDESFILNLTSNKIVSSVLLNYSGTFSAMTSSGGLWSKTFDVSNSNTGIQYFNYMINYSDGVSDTTTLNNQTIKELLLINCNATFPTKFLNFTFKNEANLTSIPASISSSTFTFYIGSGTNNKSYTYSNSTELTNYNFCGNVNETYTTQYTMRYTSTGYNIRQRYVSSTSLTNTTTNTVLYLLTTADSSLKTFQTVDSINNLLSGVKIIVERIISGTYQTVASALSGSAGSASFYLDTDTEYRITASKTGYTSQVITLIPAESEYTITLGSSAGNQITDNEENITITVLPKINTLLLNDTNYNFNMTIVAGNSNLDKFGIFLIDGSGNVITSSNSTTAGGGTINVLLNVSDNKTITMKYFWVVNSSLQYREIKWNIFNTQYNSWSIANFFTDVNNYLDAGMFGIDNFGRLVIVYLILFITLGVMSYKYGARSPASLSIVVFAVIYFFDRAVNILPTPTGLFEGFYSFMAGLVMVVLILKEVMTR